MRLCRREDHQRARMKTGSYICKNPHARRELGHDENANAGGGIRQAERSVGGAVRKIWGGLSADPGWPGVLGEGGGGEGFEELEDI